MAAAARSRSERELELDRAAAEKHDRGEELTPDEKKRAQAVEQRALAWIQALHATKRRYERAGITAANGYPSSVVAEAEIQELELRRRRPSTRAGFTAAVIRRLRTAGAVPPVESRPDRAAPRRPRSRAARRQRRASPDREAPDDESDPPSQSPVRLTFDVRDWLKKQIDAKARERVEREKRLGLPGLDPKRYCKNGHLWAEHKRPINDASRPGGVKFICGACADDGAEARYVESTKPSYWLPAVPTRVAVASGLLAGHQLEASALELVTRGESSEARTDDL